MYRITYLILILIFKICSVYSTENNTVNDVPDALVNLTAGNELWTSLLRECKKPTLTCIQNSIYKYLKSTLDYPSDVQFTSFLKFTKNNLIYSNISRSLDIDNDTLETDDVFKSDSPIEEMSRSLHDNTVKFLMTHDVELQLPETLFHGSTLKISPRSLEGNGALVKLEVDPKLNNEVGEGRLFFKKIRKFISERLLYALLAVLLVVKLLAVKFLFVLPLIVGAATAKKLLIKTLLFFFPFLHHLFKFCAYYPTQAAYHHHKHLISHIHSIGHPSKHHPHKHHHHHPASVEVIAPHADGPPTYIHDDHDHHEYSDPTDVVGLYPGAPALIDNGFISHRNDPQVEENDVDPSQVYNKQPGAPNRRLTKTEIENMVLKAEKEALIKAHLQKEKQRIEVENLKLQDQLNKAIQFQEKLKQKAVAVGSNIPPKLAAKFGINTPVGPPNHPMNGRPLLPNGFHPSPEITFPQVPQIYTPYNKAPQQNPPLAPHTHPPKQTPAYPVYERPSVTPKPEEKPVQPEIFTPSRVEASTTEKPKPEHEIYKAAAITYDPFYSPILEKIDKVLNGLGIVEEPCRERLICSMYKNPTKFSPHSNLLSAELSRDSTELQKPLTTNAVVIRFYKYVQAARDGQDGRDCLRLYPMCTINTEAR